jgi:DNA polymerase-1
MPAHEALLQVEKNGMAVDYHFLEAVEREMEVALTHALVNCREVADDFRFNPMSYQQVAHILFDILGYKQANPKYFPKRSTSVQAMKEISKYQPQITNEPIMLAVFEYRRINKMLGTYVKPMGSWMDVAGRIHPSYKIHAAETGRLSAEKPPIQTLPRAGRDRFGDMIRASVIAGPPHSVTGRKRKLVFADYSQAELRVAAHFTQDPFLLAVYRQGRDLHSEAAKRLFGDNYTKEQRVYCKNFNFAWFYGGNEYSFANQVNLPIEEAAALVREYERLMPVATKWRKDQMARAVRQGFVDTPFGRRRRFPLITKETLQDVERASINMPIQSTASDLNLLTAVEMVRLKRKVVLSMHDATCVECWEDQVDDVSAELSRVMIGLGDKYIPTVPWVVEVDVGDRWSPKVDVDDPSVIVFDDAIEVDSV